MFLSVYLPFQTRFHKETQKRKSSIRNVPWLQNEPTIKSPSAIKLFRKERWRKSSFLNQLNKYCTTSHLMEWLETIESPNTQIGFFELANESGQLSANRRVYSKFFLNCKIILNWFMNRKSFFSISCSHFSADKTLFQICARVYPYVVIYKWNDWPSMTIKTHSTIKGRKHQS